MSSHLQAKNMKILMYGIGIMFENRVLRKKIFGYKWGEIICNWRKAHNELHHFHSYTKYYLGDWLKDMGWVNPYRTNVENRVSS